MRNISGDYIGKRKITKRIDPKIRKKWIVVANRVEAVIYSDARVKLVFIKRLSNPKGKLAEGMLDSDKPGRGFSSAGNGTIHHSLDRTFTHHEQAAKTFARQISNFLETSKREKLFSELVLVAEPHFLGLLRSEFSEPLCALVNEEMNRELLRGSDDDFLRWIAKKSKQMKDKERSKVTRES